MIPLHIRLICLHTLLTYCQASTLAPYTNEQADTSASLTDLGNLVMPNYTSVQYNSTESIPTNSSNLLDLIVSPTTTPSNALGLFCNGMAYGSNVPLGSCLDAYRQIPDDTTYLIFALRYTVSCDVALPVRWISCMLLPSPESRFAANVSGSGWTLHHRCSD